MSSPKPHRSSTLNRKGSKTVVAVVKEYHQHQQHQQQPPLLLALPMPKSIIKGRSPSSHDLLSDTVQTVGSNTLPRKVKRLPKPLPMKPYHNQISEGSTTKTTVSTDTRFFNPFALTTTGNHHHNNNLPSNSRKPSIDSNGTTLHSFNMNRFSDLSSISSSSSNSPSFYSKRCSYQELESGREIPESELQEWSEQEQEEEESEKEEEEEEEADTPRLSHLTTSSGSQRSSRISISPIAVAVGSSSYRRGSNSSTAKTAFRASSLSSVSSERRRIDFESLFVVLEEDLAAAAAAGTPQRFQRRGSEGSVLWESKARSLSNTPAAAAGDTLTRRPTRSSSKNQQTIPTIFPTTTTAPNYNSSCIADQQQQLNDDQDTLLADEIVKLYASSRKHIPSTLLIRKDSIQVRRQSIQRRSILSANSATPVVPAVAPLVIQTHPPVKDSRVVSVAISEIDYDPIDSFIDCHMMDESIENSRVVETKPDIQLEKEEQATSLKTTTSTAAGQPPSAIMSRLYGLLGNLEPSGHSSSSNNDEKDTSVTPSTAPPVTTTNPKIEAKPLDTNQPKNLIKTPDFLQTTTTAPNPPRNNLNPAAADIVVPKVSVMDRIKLFESNDSTTTAASSASNSLLRRKFAPVTAAKPTLVLTTPTTTVTTTTAATTTNAKIDTLKTPDTPYPSSISINSVNDSQRPPRVVSILKKPRNALETTVFGGGGSGYQRRPYTKTSYSSASLPYYSQPQQQQQLPQGTQRGQLKNDASLSDSSEWETIEFSSAATVAANRHMSIFSVDSGLVRRARRESLVVPAAVAATTVADNQRFYSMGRRSPTARIS